MVFFILIFYCKYLSFLSLHSLLSLSLRSLHLIRLSIAGSFITPSTSLSSSLSRHANSSPPFPQLFHIKSLSFLITLFHSLDSLFPEARSDEGVAVMAWVLNRRRGFQIGDTHFRRPGFQIGGVGF
ncbi:hypothetical protein ACB092_03G004100 [Castanea dentata]